MKNLLKIFIISSILLTHLADKQSELAIKALQTLIFELFDRRGHLFEILIVDELSIESRNVLDGVLNEFQGTRVRSVRKFNATQRNVGFEGVKTAVIFLNPKSLLNLQRQILTYSPESFFGFIFYIDNEKVDLTSFASNPSAFEGTLDHFSYFLVNRKKSFELKTFEWWTETACNQFQLITLNSFSKKTTKWRTEFRMQEKFVNFHGCSLKYVSAVFIINLLNYLRKNRIFHLPPHLPKGFYEIENLDMKVINIFAKFGNFTIYRPPLENREYIELSFPGNTNSDLNLDFYFYHGPMKFEYKELYCTSSFIDQEITAIYSPPEPYTNYEKMVLPFDTDTWMYLMITFAVAFTSIFILNFLPRIIKNVILGKNVSMPAFNLIQTSFGIGQTKLPKNNFARIILMSFILFCLVFRTAYQGVFFEMLTSDMRRRPPKTFLDLKNKNYTLLIPDDKFSASVILGIIPEDERPIIKEASFYDLFESFNRISDYSSKSAITLTKIDISTSKVMFKNLKVIPELIRIEPFGVCTNRNNFAFNLIKKVMTSIIQGGIPQYLLDYFLSFELKQIQIQDDKTGPKVFSISDLEFGFIVWLIACVISIFVFICELLWYFLRVKLLNIIKKYAGLYAIVTSIKEIMKFK